MSNATDPVTMARSSTAKSQRSGFSASADKLLCNALGRLGREILWMDALMAVRVGLGRAVAAVYEAPNGTILPHLAVVLLDGEVITARAMNAHEDAAKYASEALKILKALELSDPDLVIDQEL